MQETTILFLVVDVSMSVLGFFAIRAFGISRSAAKLAQESQRLGLLINKARALLDEMPETSQAAPQGITGLMSQYGIDPNILSSPVVKALVRKYAPKLLEQLTTGDKESPKGY